MLASVFLPQLLAYSWLWSQGAFPRAEVSFLATLAALGAVVAGTLPVVIAYLWLTPTPAALGLWDDGLVVQLTSARVPSLGFRQAYRWRELRLDRTGLHLPKRGRRSVRTLRPTRAQRAALAAYLPGAAG